MLTKGNANYVVELFQDLVACFQEAGYLDSLDWEAAINLRQQSAVGDVFGYLESNASYQCQTHVKQVIRLVRVIVSPAPVAKPAADISISGTNLPTSVIRSGLGAIQSFVLHPKFMASDLLTVGHLQ